MKKLINKLLAATLFLGVVGNSTAEEWKTYKIKANNDERKKSEDVITLDEGDKAEFVHFVSTHSWRAVLEIKIRFDDDFAINQSFYANISQESPSRYGTIVPSELQIIC